jgi:2-oxoglutarate/2-oxoacid ferredoxin oxidoreductase subunit alpha
MSEKSHTQNGDMALVLAGEAGQGIQTIESMLTLLAKRNSYHVFATKEYMSRVRGGCNSTEIRIARRPVSARVDRIDVLVALSADAVPHLEGRIGDGTLILGEKETVGAEGMADIPFSRIAAEAGSPLYANSAAAGAISGLLGFDRAASGAVARGLFEDKGAEVASANERAFLRGYELGAEIAKSPAAARLPTLGPASGAGARASSADDIMITGAEALSLGAIAGGCDYVCAYPMSPGTTVLTTMAAYSKRFDILVEQVEDEIGVANMALGAWYAGARALVTTSGGGFALMTEAVSLSGMIETPMVVHIAQRPGPATGLPTRTEQGDLNLAMHAGHGDFLRVVLAPGDLAEGFELMRAAFDIADRCQSPVFVLSDQYYVDSYYTTKGFELPDRILSNRTIETGPGYRRYALGSPDGLSPRGLPGIGSGIVCVDSDEHDEGGYITEDKAVRRAMVAKRLAKIEAARRDIIPPRLYGGEGGYRVLVLGWGSVKGPVLEALAALGRDDIAYLHFPWVHPLPGGVADYLARAEAVVAVEGNATGQFADLVELETGMRIDRRILKSDGAQYGVEELVDRISANAIAKGVSA